MLNKEQDALFLLVFIKQNILRFTVQRM